MRHTWQCIVWGSLLFALSVVGQGRTQERTMSLPERRGVTPGTLQKHEQIQTVAARYQKELSQIPGVYVVTGGWDRILVGVFVHTDSQGNKPAMLPPTLQAIPRTLESYPVEIAPLYILPPPSGVIVLEPLSLPPGTELCPPEAVRTWNLDHFECFAVAEVCPPAFREKRQFDWRFCLPPDGFTFPNPMSPPIAGIPFEKVQEIWARRSEEIMRLPGVRGGGIGAGGIVVRTEIPEAVPSVLEGVPVVAEFFQGILTGADLRGYPIPNPDERDGQ